MGIIVRNPEVPGGTPVFRGTRVPIQTLFDYLEGGETLEDFLEGFPTVTREAALAALEEAKQLLLARSKLRVLIDECIDERFGNALSRHECQTARYAGFAGLKEWRASRSRRRSEV
jgi:uncharacterized protein (DUF433 family)